jgi:hypothetical protein
LSGLRAKDWFIIVATNHGCDDPIPSKAHAELLEQASDHIEIAWTSGTTPFDREVTGDVVWSSSLQRGFLRFVGMPINDRSLQQYQLWIIDSSRDDKPIDVRIAVSDIPYDFRFCILRLA